MATVEIESFTVPRAATLTHRNMFWWSSGNARMLVPLQAKKEAAEISIGSLGSEATSKKFDTPLLDALRRCAQQEDVAAFHFPGHRRGASAPSSLANLIGKSVFEYDLPELPELDNLHAPEAAIADAQKKAAALFGAEATWFLVNGSTCGIQAAVMSTCRPGDYLILPRNCHMSAVSAMVLSGALPSYVLPAYDLTWGIAHGVTVAAIEAAILQVRRNQGKVGAVLIVSPTYFGICSHVKEIADLCHRYGIPLIVDEAHGAHFRFHSEFPETALEQGADVAVQSTHKVLCSFTQSAMLHVQGSEISHERISKCLRSLQSSSPSYLLMVSLDAARAQMSRMPASGNHVLFDSALEMASKARSSLKSIPGISVLDRETIHAETLQEIGAVGTDELRITVGLWELGITGTEADDLLREKHKVVAELPSFNSLTFAVSTGTTVNDVKQLVHGLKSLSFDLPPSSSALLHMKDASICENSRIWEQHHAVLSPRDAFYAEVDRLSSKDAVGHVSAELICPYPPGIPVVFPGEVISQEALSYLKQACESDITISGASDPSLSTILVCK